MNTVDKTESIRCVGFTGRGKKCTEIIAVRSGDELQLASVTCRIYLASNRQWGITCPVCRFKNRIRVQIGRNENDK